MFDISSLTIVCDVQVDAKSWEVVETAEIRSIRLAQFSRFDTFGEDAVVAGLLLCSFCS
jgi:hypothetical protein